MFILCLLISLSLLFALCGCGAMTQQVMTGYESSALKSIEAADDNTILIWTTTACGTPYSAAIRNVRIIPALKALCLPSGSDSSPITLLDIIPVKK